MVERSPDTAAEVKRQQMIEGQKILAFAARGRDILAHGTGSVRYEVILEQGKLMHRKGNIQYAPLEFLAGGGRGPMDQGNGLFVRFPEHDSHENIFVKADEGHTVDLKHHQWIVLPKCEVDIARSSECDSTTVARYRDKIVTYEELASKLGFDPDHNRITPEILQISDAYAQQLFDMFHGPEKSTTEKVIDAARVHLAKAAAKGASGIIEAALILDKLFHSLPDHKRVRYERQATPESTRITASDDAWYAILDLVDSEQETYRLFLRDRRKGRNIVIGRSRIETNDYGTYFE